MTTETIVYQSAVDSGGNPRQQISNLKLDGFVTIDGFMNSDSGKLYGTFSYNAGTYTLNLYMDLARANLVASCTSTISGLAQVQQAYSSGITGTVNIIPGTAVPDNAIEVICFFSDDSDIPMDNLQGTSDYDGVFGFADFSRQSYEYVKNVMQSRYESLLWNDSWVDYNQINGGTGGYDYSRILNWDHPDIREASAQYVLHLIARKQSVEPGGLFAERAKAAYERCVALLNSVEMAFDTNSTRVPRKTRSNSTFRIGRA